MAGTFTSAFSDGNYDAFVPDSLPPTPPLALEPEDHRRLERANQKLGRLDGLVDLLPDTELFIYFYIRKEAVLSSQIEGTQSSLSDLLLFEHDVQPDVPENDVRAVSNYVAAMEHGLERLREDDFPLSLRLLREIHRRLLESGRGSDKKPGEFRNSQNWIGGSRPGDAKYVPPPPSKLRDVLDDWETYLHDSTAPPHSMLLKTALLHARFETIHPFLDGNGRVGRLFITLRLCAAGILDAPTLYLSYYFKRRRDEYYRRLQRTRVHGEFEEWIRFFLRGIIEVAESAVSAARDILELFERDRDHIRAELGASAGSGLNIHDALQEHLVVSVADAAGTADVSEPTARRRLEDLRELGMVEEVTGKQRNRRYVYREYLDRLDEGTTVPP